MNRTLSSAVILSEAKNLGSILNHRPHGDQQEMFRFVQQHSAFVRSKVRCDS